jgi:hypothetical protein
MREFPELQAKAWERLAELENFQRLTGGMSLRLSI